MTRVLTLETGDESPRQGQKSAREVELQEVADDERIEALLEGLAPAEVGDVSEPGQTEEINDDVPREHRGHRRRDAPVQTSLREESCQSRRDHEPDEVAAGRPFYPFPAPLTPGVDRRTDHANEHVQSQAGGPHHGAEPGADEESREGLERDWDRREAEMDLDLSAEGDECRTADHEQNARQEPGARKDRE